MTIRINGSEILATIPGTAPWSGIATASASLYLDANHPENGVRLRVATGPRPEDERAVWITLDALALFAGYALGLSEAGRPAEPAPAVQTEQLPGLADHAAGQVRTGQVIGGYTADDRPALDHLAAALQADCDCTNCAAIRVRYGLPAQP